MLLATSSLDRYIHREQIAVCMLRIVVLLREKGLLVDLYSIALDSVSQINLF